MIGKRIYRIRVVCGLLLLALLPVSALPQSLYAKGWPLRSSASGVEDTQEQTQQEDETPEERAAVLCPSETQNEYIDEAVRITNDFSDVYEVASGTARIALSPVVREMQELKRELENLSPTLCDTHVHNQLVEGMDLLIDGFLYFMRNESLNARRSFREGNTVYANAMLDLLVLQNDPAIALRPTPTSTPTPHPTPTRTPRPTSTPIAAPIGSCQSVDQIDTLFRQITCICGTVTEVTSDSIILDESRDFAVVLRDDIWRPTAGAEVKACGYVYKRGSPLVYSMTISQGENLTLYEE